MTNSHQHDKSPSVRAAWICVGVAFGYPCFLLATGGVLTHGFIKLFPAWRPITAPLGIKGNLAVSLIFGTVMRVDRELSDLAFDVSGLRPAEALRVLREHYTG